MVIAGPGWLNDFLGRFTGGKCPILDRSRPGQAHLYEKILWTSLAHTGIYQSLIRISFVVECSAFLP